MTETQPSQPSSLTLETPKDLAQRFTQPENWQWGSLDQGDYQLRYGFVTPDGNIPPKHLIIALPGLSEFSEKYFELAHDALSRGYGFAVLDWRGQGLSTRYLPDNLYKRHSHGFEKDADDLKSIIDILPFSTDKTVFCMLAHSMGGQIGLRFLERYPGLFKAAVFSAPLVGLHIFQHIPQAISAPLTGFLNRFWNESYAPMGGDWEPYSRDMQSGLFFSSDPERAAVHNTWMKAHPALRIGHITNKWLSDAYDSCHHLNTTSTISKIDIPCKFFIAEHEKFIDNDAVWRLSVRLPNAECTHIPGARHEIWMETDSIRSAFLTRCFSFFDSTHLNINE